MILLPETIRQLKILTPCLVKYKVNGVSGGLSHCGYDIAIKQTVLIPSGGFVLASSLERFTLPLDVVGTQHDKSSWARRGIATQATVLEPGWEGWLTLELSNHGPEDVLIQEGTPIAQILFHRIEGLADGYQGKYQNQINQPVAFIYEH